jgi:hypothetical protein
MELFLKLYLIFTRLVDVVRNFFLIVQFLVVIHSLEIGNESKLIKNFIQKSKLLQNNFTFISSNFFLYSSFSRLNCSNLSRSSLFNDAAVCVGSA